MKFHNFHDVLITKGTSFLSEQTHLIKMWYKQAILGWPNCANAQKLRIHWNTSGINVVWFNGNGQFLYFPISSILVDEQVYCWARHPVGWKGEDRRNIDRLQIIKEGKAAFHFGRESS